MRIIGVLLLFILLFTIKHAESRPVIIAFMADYEPVSFISAHGDPIGVNPDIIRETLSTDPKLKLELVGLPWIRAQQMVKDGEADATIALITPERLSYATPSKVPLFNDSYRAFTYAGHPKMKELMKIRNLSELHNFTVCEYLGSGWAKANLVGKVKSIEYGRSIDIKIFMLAAHRCDLIIDLGFLINANSKHYHLNDKIVELPAVFSGTAFYLMVSKKSPYQNILSIFDKQATIMHKNGRIKEIIYKWTGETHPF